MARIIKGRVLATTGHLISHCGVYCCGHLAQANLRAEYREAEITHGIILHPHDVLQPQTPPQEETDGTHVHREPSAATPAPQRFPERTNSADSIGMGNSNHRAAESLEANPLVVCAAQEAVVEIIAACVCAVLHHMIQLATLNNGANHRAVVQDREAHLNDQRTSNPSHGAAARTSNLRPDHIPLGALHRTGLQALGGLEAGA